MDGAQAAQNGGSSGMNVKIIVVVEVKTVSRK